MSARTRPVLVVLFFLLPTHSWAQDFYQGVRQMGMGGAAVAVVNDETSLLLNPNGLARLREPYITFVDGELSGNSDRINELSSLNINAIKPESLYNELADVPDQPFFARAQTFPSFANRGYGLGFLAKYDVRAMRLSSNQNLVLNYISDWAAVAGYNHSFFDGIIKVGATGKLIDRIEFNGSVDPATESLNIRRLATEGMGLGLDMGLSLSSPTDLLPTVSVVARDIGRTSFTLADGLRDYPNDIVPTPVEMSVDAGLAIFPIISNHIRSTLTVEMDDLTEEGPYQDFIRKFHAGAELNFHDKYFFRVGYNRGYMTGGLEWASRFLQIQLAYYGEEIGTDANPVQEDRFSLKMILRF